MVLAMGFIAVIPFTKLRHIFTGTAQYFLVDLSPKGTIATINLEDESVEQYGAAKVTRPDLERHFRCRCLHRLQTLPGPLSGLGHRQAAFADEGRPADRRGLRLRSRAETCRKPWGPDALWACTTCRACQEICPANIEHVNKILEMRRNLSLMEGAFPGDEVRTAVSNIEVNGNPFGLAFATRGDWARVSTCRIVEQADEVDILYFVGCYASFDKRNQRSPRASSRSATPPASGSASSARRRNAAASRSGSWATNTCTRWWPARTSSASTATGVKRIVTTCPHCFNTLARDYRDLGLDRPGRTLHAPSRTACSPRAGCRYACRNRSTSPITTPATWDATWTSSTEPRARPRRRRRDDCARWTNRATTASAAAPAAAGSWPRRSWAGKISEERVRMARRYRRAAAGIQLPLLPDDVRGRHQDRGLRRRSFRSETWRRSWRNG